MFLCCCCCCIGKGEFDVVVVAVGEGGFDVEVGDFGLELVTVGWES